MAGTKIGIILTAFITATLWAGAAAQSSCTNTLISMSPCLDYISGNSSRPSSSCCTQLSSVTKSQPQCLCQALTGSGASSLGLNINRTQALALPSACKVQTPPVSQCKGAASPAGTSNSPATPSGSGSGNPTTDGNSSSGNSIKLSFSLFCALLFIASTFIAM